MAKVEHFHQRDDGSEIRIVAEAFFGRGLKCSIDVRVHRRESRTQPWTLLSNQPHPDWRKMSVSEYLKRGRSEVRQAVSPGEILKATSSLVSLPSMAGLYP